MTPEDELKEKYIESIRTVAERIRELSDELYCEIRDYELEKRIAAEKKSK